MIDIFTFDYNSSELTNACLKSIFKNKSMHKIDKRVHVFQNGDIDIDIDDDMRENVEILNISSGIVFNRPKPDNQHSFCIQHALNISKSDNIVICDCDILFKPDTDIMELIDDEYITIGQEALYPNSNLNRIHPCLQYLNRRMIIKNDTVFYNGKTHATGDYFYQQVMKKHLPVKTIKTEKYCYHLRISTYDNGNSESHFQKSCHIDFINKHQECWR